MGQTLQAGVAPGLALAGLLAVAGIAAARFGRTLPHVGIGAVGVGVAASAGRLTAAPTWVVVAALIAGGAVLGVVAAEVDARARRARRPLWPPPLLPDVAVLALAVGVGAVLRPPLTVDLPVGPLGGFPAISEAVVALGLGLIGAAAIVWPAVSGRSAHLTWAIVAAITAAIAVLGSGALTLRTQAVAPVFAVVDVAGLGLRAAAVGVVARYGALWGVGAALLIGVGEALLVNVLPVLNVGLLPAVLLLSVGLWDAGRDGHAVTEAEPA